ncbi:hypothetical protein CISG_01758 [Coccidioides immitis RMSCC 3703]|uniref:Uncharacterized protein n=1 Tax=Coccidioides immitis RMSCC 3703 TaxID=454286 RepID=A0A0J8R4U0_COCIT|nr:hypothetical protein CISG_01758 [Coccidioides immitis RMSCC 3703]
MATSGTVCTTLSQHFVRSQTLRLRWFVSRSSVARCGVQRRVSLEVDQAPVNGRNGTLRSLFCEFETIYHPIMTGVRRVGGMIKCIQEDSNSLEQRVNEESCGLNYPTLQAAMLEKLPRLRTFDLNLAGLHNISPSSFDSFMPDPEHFSTRALLSGKNTEFPVIAYILSCGISSSGWTTRPASSSLV